MPNIKIYIIEKKLNDCYDIVTDDLLKNFKQFGKIEIIQIFNKTISKSNKTNNPKQIYTKIYEKYLSDFNIALDVQGKKIDSFKFANILKDKQNINFFIGGAYGFEDRFLQMCDISISLSNLTLSHKIAKVVLVEQIFRGFSILKNHPYHKI